MRTYAHFAFGLAAMLTLLFGGYFIFSEWQSQHRTFLAILIASQFGLAVLGLGYVLFSPKREFSKDVQTLRWLALALPVLTAGAMFEFYKSWFVLTAGWAAIEVALLLLLIRPLNLWAVIRNKGEPGEPPKGFGN